MSRLPLARAVFLPAAAFLFTVGVAAQSTTPARVAGIRFWSFGDVTRIAIETEGDYKLSSDQVGNPARVYFDLTGLRPPATLHHGVQVIPIRDRQVKQIRVAEVSPGKTRVVVDLEGPVAVVSSQLVNPDRVMIEIRPKTPSTSNVFLAHSTTGSQKIDLSTPEDSKNIGGAEPLSSPLKTGATIYPPPAPAAVRSDTSPSTQTGISRPPDTKQAEPSREQVAPLTASVPASAPISDSNLPAKSPPVEVPSASLIASRESPAQIKPVARNGGSVATPAGRDSSGDRSLVRVFGLKLGKVVIDAGHGGHDTGTIGPNGLMEKDLVLDVALRLGKLISQELGAEVVYTRSGDVFIPLEERTRIANREKADLFISVHANSSPESSATGVETYFFNLTSDKIGLDLATRENATSTSSISDLNDLLHKAVLENKLEESREFAQKVQSALWSTSVKMNNRSRDRGVRQAPFMVLIGASMPSILAEIGFVSNPHDERFLKRSDQRQKIAESLCKGIVAYASTLSHVQVARTRGK